MTCQLLLCLCLLSRSLSLHLLKLVLLQLLLVQSILLFVELLFVAYSLDAVPGHNFISKVADGQSTSAKQSEEDYPSRGDEHHESSYAVSWLRVYARFPKFGTGGLHCT